MFNYNYIKFEKKSFKLSAEIYRTDGIVFTLGEKAYRINPLQYIRRNSV